MNDISSWFEEINTQPSNWELRAIFSDWLTDHGQEILAYGQHWQIANKKYCLGGVLTGFYSKHATRVTRSAGNSIWTRVRDLGDQLWCSATIHPLLYYMYAVIARPQVWPSGYEFAETTLLVADSMGSSVKQASVPLIPKLETVERSLALALYYVRMMLNVNGGSVMVNSISAALREYGEELKDVRLMSKMIANNWLEILDDGVRNTYRGLSVDPMIRWYIEAGFDDSVSRKELKELIFNVDYANLFDDLSVKSD